MKKVVMLSLLSIIAVGCGRNLGGTVTIPDQDEVETVYVNLPPLAVPCPSPTPSADIQCLPSTFSPAPQYVQDGKCVTSCSTGYSLTRVYGKNAVVNGSFEDITGLVVGNRSAGNWGVYKTIPNWTTYLGAGIEVRFNGYLGGDNTTNFIEMDSDNNSGMQQQFNAPKQGRYVLHSDYYPRTNSFSDNDIQFKIDGVPVMFLSGLNADYPLWRGFEVQVDLSQGSHVLQVEAQGINNSLGGYVDNISLSKISTECRK